MSLYLKYRPADFTNLVWQSFVKETLQKAIENDKTVWAYLFCWPRWTGKTSTARIFAKSVNCLNPIKWNPCLKCEICLDFADEKLIDIIEIDAASHTWVDNIREIIEKAQFSPNKTKYKIYIIDEVHMLSKWAFNALLKILEEPPKHVKFILATTETHKVPETIISRCQRYDFKRISDKDIKDRLWYIAKEEKIKTDEKSIQYIIKNSSWWLRNAISLFEQLIFDWEINYKTIVEKLEIVDENEIDLFLEKLVNSDRTVIEILEKNISDWKNIKLFFKELLFYTKNKSLEILTKWWEITKYIRILDILDDSYTKTKHSLDENITFIIGILKILDSYTEINPLNTKTQTINNTVTKKTEIINTVAKEEVKNVKKEELSHKDIWDIFWDEPIIQEIKSDTIDLWTFDVKLFIEKLKNNWVKSSNINTIKNSKLNLTGNILKIQTTNAFLKKTIDKNDIIGLFIKSLSDMWITESKIDIS